jgi:NADPH:quinone reductase-like Zn-dependent oxidoreductase
MTAPMMKAIAVAGGKGSATQLHAVQIPRPVPRDGQILIRVTAAGVNRPDVLQRLGLYPPPPGESGTLGLEVAGEVFRPAGRWREQDKVCALLGGGAMRSSPPATHGTPCPFPRDCH